jgi:hypothetical protein
MKQEDNSSKDQSKTTEYTNQDYVIEENQGFWHRIDRRIEKLSATAQKMSESKYWTPFKIIGQATKTLWNSKPMAPIKWAVSKAASTINKVLNHPATQFASFVVGTTLAITALVAAAPASVPLAAATLGIIAGGKIVKTAYDARKSYRFEQLEKQLELLEKLKKIHEHKKTLLQALPEQPKKSIEQNLTKRKDTQPIHNLKLKAKSQIVAENVAANFLGLTATAMDFTQIPRSIHSASQMLDILSTSKDAKESLEKPKEIRSESTEERKTENELRAKINRLSRELNVPKVTSNLELKEFVANSAADNIALSKALKAEHGQYEQAFLDEKKHALTDATHLSDLPKTENRAKKAAIHVGKAFFGISSENNIVTPPPRLQNNNIDTPNDKSRRIG